VAPVHAEVRSGKLPGHTQLEWSVLEAIAAAVAAAGKFVAAPVLVPVVVAQIVGIAGLGAEPVMAGIGGLAAGSLASVLVGDASRAKGAGLLRRGLSLLCCSRSWLLDLLMEIRPTAALGTVRMIGASRHVREVAENRPGSLAEVELDIEVDTAALTVRHMLTFDCRVEDKATGSRLGDMKGKVQIERRTSSCQEALRCNSFQLHLEHEMVRIVDSDTWCLPDAVVHIRHISTDCMY